ncbi:MAG: hypothetical protein LBR25_02020 [Erysipelotrichaceae bacterium]|jgi:hypothetical protein|nr:hypothetical protein [Erysipelotrichaceae bacterium]
MVNRNKPSVASYASAQKEWKYMLFLDAIEQYFECRQVPCIIRGDWMSIGDSGENYDLDLWFRRYEQVNPQEYPICIEQHLNTLQKTMQLEKEIQRHDHDFDFIRPYLATTLYKHDCFDPESLSEIVCDSQSGDLLTTLVFDLPTLMEPVRIKQTEHWQLSLSELLALGKENIRQKYPLEYQETGFRNDSIFKVQTSHRFAVNFLFELDKHPRLLGVKGSLVAMPSYNQLWIYPINSLRLIAVLKELMIRISTLYAKLPDPLTPDIYWYRRHSFTTALTLKPQSRHSYHFSSELADLITRMAKKRYLHEVFGQWN